MNPRWQSTVEGDLRHITSLRERNQPLTLRSARAAIRRLLGEGARLHHQVIPGLTGKLDRMDAWFANNAHHPKHEERTDVYVRTVLKYVRAVDTLSRIEEEVFHGARIHGLHNAAEAILAAQSPQSSHDHSVAIPDS